MILALLLLAGAPDWVPARWHSNNPKSLDLVAQTPVNCVLIEKPQWSLEFNDAAVKRGIAALGVIRPGGATVDDARRAVALHMTGVVLEGDFDAGVNAALADSKITIVELPSRARMRFDQGRSVVGTWQGVWPGVLIEEGAVTKSGPSGAPWIDTNTGFLRFVRAATDGPVWIANTPPPKKTFSVERYQEVIGDAAASGARWVVALDEDFETRLLAGDAKAVEGWKRIGGHLRYYESHAEWKSLRPHANLALVEGVKSGALLSGGILDMIAVKNTPVRAVPDRKLSGDSMAQTKMAVNIDPDSLTLEQKEVLKAFTRNGGTLLTGPPGWKFPAQKDGQITLAKDDLEKLDEMWKELNSMTGRRNMGARLFNVSSMLSNLLEAPGGKPVVLHLVNYADYPMEAVTVHLLGSFKKASLFMPGAAPKDLPVYEVEEGTGVDIDQVNTVATLVLN